MKRYLAIGAGVLVLAFAGWFLAWSMGRGEVERAIDDGVARLQEGGWQVAWDGREIGGFPFGYTVRLTGLTATDTDTGFALRLPWALAETAGTDRIVVRLPERFDADLPLPEPVGMTGAAGTDAEGTEADGTEPEGTGADGTEPQATGPEATAPDGAGTVPATGEADDLILVLASDGTAEVTADRVAWTLDDPDAGRRVTQSVEGLEATTVPDSPGARYRMHAALIGTEAELPAEGGGSTAVVTIRDVTVEGASTLPTTQALGEMLYAGGPGRAEGSLSTGSAEVRIEGTGDRPGLLDWRAEATRGEALLTSGRMELEGETRRNVWTLTSPDPSLPVQGQLSVDLARAHYAMPMAPSERPDAMALGLALTGAVADERIWAQLDPEGALPRAPASLTVDLSGTVRVTRRIDRLSPGAEPPFEISTIVLDEVAADALGANLQATGEVEVLQPVGVPLGEIRLGVTGLAGLIRTLGRAGVLSPDMVTTAEAIMEVYLRPAGGDDAWTAVIGFTREGAEVNGLPVR